MSTKFRLTKAMVEQAEKLARESLPHESIASILGIGTRTLRRWKERGEKWATLEGTEDFRPSPNDLICMQFGQALKKGYGQAERTIVQSIRSALANGQWQAGKFLLLTNPHFNWADPDGKRKAVERVISAVRDGEADVIQELLAALDNRSLAPSE